MTSAAPKRTEVWLRRWFRPLVVASVGSIHAAVLAAGTVSYPKPVSADAIEIAIDTMQVPLPEAVNAPPPVPESEPEQPKEIEQPPEPAPEKIPPEPAPPLDLLEPPRQEPPIPEPPKPEPPQPPKEVTKPQPSAVEFERQREKRLKAKQQAPAVSQQRQAMAAEATQARATFGAIVAARINAAKFYPSEARSAGIVGVVGIRFAIGSDGRVTQASLSQTSGSAVLDAAALQIFRSLKTPEPPGGSFSGQINIRYSLERL